MTFQVHIQNYQSIEDANLEISGLTIIVGQNNTGKSAIMRALRGPFMNTNGNGYIRHDATRMCVRHDFSDGESIQWEKVGEIPTKGKNKGKLSKIKANYIINGQEFNEVGQSVPEEALKLGVHPIQIGSDKVWPQVASQVDGTYFLVNRPGYAVAEAVADVDRVGKLNKALRLCDKDARSTSAQQKIREKDLKKLEAQIGRFDGLDSVLESVSKIETLQTELLRVQKGLETVTALQTRYKAATQSVKGLEWVLGVDIPSLKQLEKMGVSIQIVTRLQTQLDKCKRDIESFSGLDEIELPDETSLKKLQKICQVMGDVNGLRARLKVVNRDLVRLKTIGSLDFDLEADLESLRGIVSEVEVVKGLQQRLAKCELDCSKASREYECAEKDLQEAEEVLRDFESQNPRCPTCGQFKKEQS